MLGLFDIWLYGSIAYAIIVVSGSYSTENYKNSIGKYSTPAVRLLYGLLYTLFGFAFAFLLAPVLYLYFTLLGIVNFILSVK